MAHLDGYLSLAVSHGASDLHFSSGQPVRMRIDGDLVIVDATVLTAEQVEILFSEILSEEERNRLVEKNNLDRSYRVDGVGNFRVNIFMTRVGLAAVLRSIPSKIPTIEELGLPDTLKTLAASARGLVLVTGPTGSGKSTTLAAMIHHINRNCPYHILTAEDPIEFVHPSLKSLVNQREIGNSCPSFADALKYALREDPDVILVGEMRDLETISLALTAAETGHLVFGTLHTRGAAASVDRIIDSFPANQQAMIRAMLSESLIAVVSQVLLKKATGKGRVAAYEIMVVNHAISNLIREGKTFQITTALQTGKKEGMILMDQNIRDLVASGQVSYEEAEAVVESATALSGLPKTAGLKQSGWSTGSSKPSGGVAPPALGGSRPPLPPGLNRAAAPPALGKSPSAMPPNLAPPPPAPKSLAGNFSPQPLTMGENTQAGIRIRPSPPTMPAAPPRPTPPAAPSLVLSNTPEESVESILEVHLEEVEFGVTLQDNEPSISGASPQAPVAPPVPGLKKKAG